LARFSPNSWAKNAKNLTEIEWKIKRNWYKTFFCFEGKKLGSPFFSFPSVENMSGHTLFTMDDLGSFAPQRCTSEFWTHDRQNSWTA
jgi:hypothetical protein